MKKIVLLSFVILISFFSFSNNEKPCNCYETANAVANSKSAKAIILSYSDYQIFQLKFYSQISQYYLNFKPGLIDKTTLNQLNNVIAKVNAGISTLKNNKNRVQEIEIKNYKMYSTELKNVYKIGTRFFNESKKLWALTSKGRKKINPSGEIYEVNSDCTRQRTDMIGACLKGVQTMQQCGIYETLGLSALQGDMDKCQEKGNNLLATCTNENSSGRPYDSYYDQMQEEIMAKMMCEENEKLKGGASNPSSKITPW